MSLKQLLDLTGRTALITGGSRGLGLQIAEGFMEMGACVVVSARKADELEAAVERLSRFGSAIGSPPIHRTRPRSPGWPRSRSRGSATSTSSSTTQAPPGARRPRTTRRRRGTR